jgi:hypothetical protein
MNAKLKIKSEKWGSVKRSENERPKLEVVRPHLNPVASQARHKLNAPKETCASRNVVPQERTAGPDAQGSVECGQEDSAVNAKLKMKEDAPLPGPPPATASRGEGGGCEAAGLTHVEDAWAAGLAGVAAAGTAALRAGKLFSLVRICSPLPAFLEKFSGRAGQAPNVQ